MPKMTGFHQQGLTRPQLLWATMLAEKREEIVKTKADRVLAIHSFSTMQSSLASLHADDTSNTISKILSKLNPVFERLKCLTAAISVVVQAEPGFASLIWGGLLVCLECVGQSYKMLSKIIDMFDSITKAMPRFEHYMELYPKSGGLEYALLQIYRHFIDACIFAIKFFRRKPWYRPITLVISNVVHNYENATKAIERCTVEFEREAKLAHDIVAAEHRRTVEDALPNLEIFPKLPPRLFSVPFPRNSMFLGHEGNLSSILEKIQNARESQNSCVIHGIGGVGKTQLALEFTYKFRDKFRYIFWLSADDEASLSGTFGRIASMLSLTGLDQGPSHLTIEVARRWLCENFDWLLVFDNVDGNPSILNQFWPPCQHGSIILTSQRTDLCLRTSWALKLLPFGEEDGSNLLLRHLPDFTDESQIGLAMELSKEVDGLPLLLVGLGGFISQSYTTLTDVLQALRESRLSAGHIFSNDATSSATFQYQRPIQLVFQLSLDRLPATARNVIDIMSMLSPEEIPESLFSEDIPEFVLGSINKIMFAKEVRKNLGSRNLTEIRTTGSEVIYSMHRSVQRSILNILDENHDRRQLTFNQAVGIIYRQLPKPSPIMVPLFEGFELFATYIPHVISIHKKFVESQPPMNPTIQFAEMICSSAAYLYERGLAKLCLAVVATGERICQQLSKTVAKPVINPPNPPPAYSETVGLAASENRQTLSLITLEANILAYGAGVLWNTGGITNRQEAQVMTWRVLELREQYIKNTPDDQLRVEDQILLANAYNDCAVQLINEGRYAEAKSYSEKSLAMKEQLLDTENHQFEFFISKIKLAFTILAEGRPEKGLDMARDAIAHIEREKGVEDPYTIHHMFQVANVWANVGDYKKAAALHKAVTRARISLFGKTNPDTLNCYFAAALCLYRIEKFTESQQNLSLCFENSEAAQWSVENTLRAEYLQALITQHLGDKAKGEALESKAIAERNGLLSKFAEGKWAKPLPGQNEFIYFDYLVNINAGRTSIGQLEMT
ncbi:hypothetical protein F4805DRAFT_442283 [Annulohypoxylon moriforme]|nr:hypothetical protein F4805DRAFT_442283 [Annulohypoxylon moriforme]